MTCKFKTPCLFWEQPCSNYGDGSARACSNYGDTLFQLWARISGFFAPPCSHNGDILNNHTPQNQRQASRWIAPHSANPKVKAGERCATTTQSTKQAVRPVDTKDRTDGLPAWLHHGQASKCGAFAEICEWGETVGSTLPFSLPKKNGEGLAW